MEFFLTSVSLALLLLEFANRSGFCVLFRIGENHPSHYPLNQTGFRNFSLLEEDSKHKIEGYLQDRHEPIRFGQTVEVPNTDGVHLKRLQDNDSYPGCQIYCVYRLPNHVDDDNFAPSGILGTYIRDPDLNQERARITTRHMMP